MNLPLRKSAEELKKMQKICVVDIAHQYTFYNYVDTFGNQYSEEGDHFRTVWSTENDQNFKQKPKKNIY
jgi:hypothetical protein